MYVRICKCVRVKLRVFPLQISALFGFFPLLFPAVQCCSQQAFHAEEIGALAPCNGGRMMLETGGGAWQGSSFPDVNGIPSIWDRYTSSINGILMGY